MCFVGPNLDRAANALARRGPSGTGTDVVKTDQIDILARTMFRHLEEIDHAEKDISALEDQELERMRDILNRDLLDGIHLDFTFPCLVTAAHLDMRALPDANATGDRPAMYTFSKPLCENHWKNVSG